MARVLSEGTRGHEIQSITLAKALAHQYQLEHITVPAPWRWALPYRMMGLGQRIRSQFSESGVSSRLIISTGRQMAGVGRWLKKNSPSEAKHVHILNPGYYFQDIDVVLVPQHDRHRYPNAITFRGNLHPFNNQWFKQHARIQNKATIALFIGNPGNTYFKQQFKADLQRIREVFKSFKLFLCGSPRLNHETQGFIRGLMKPAESLWLDVCDGDNPYQTLLANADKIFVTADSINMMNEAGASSAAVTLLARDYIPSKKHQRFMQSIEYRLSDFEGLDKAQPLPDPVKELLENTDLLKRLELA
ncbi:nucleoside-diphosphate sugar epimerase [Marinicella pacifica]|uniref:Nucleoside-diphosphate sugar epimerase n=2 Tax=Marinicella pacifica TaxID=1171543 RepID=A0A917CP26_9GAMM|nr:ELM1/GtrOC1 family putative glycosyltransferase [Marinicella pacifica]GGF93703.1 nucleoside-diphosphate sugar epimerase [Marinicella pacifica]